MTTLQDIKAIHATITQFNDQTGIDNTREKYNTIYHSLYVWQKDTITATAEYTESCLIAANRIGKTYLGTFIDAVHATGIYPDDWQGYRFTHAPLIWCLGYSGEKTRDLLQAPIFGRKEGQSLTGGLIPASKIKACESMAGTAGAMRSVLIAHVLGESKLQFWSYSQGQHALMGDNVDWFHVDEEPKDQTIYPQVLTRTATGGNVIDKAKNMREGGRGILTFTPENGRTETVIKFMDNPGKKQFFIRKGWDDAPHLSEQAKSALLDSYPAHQKEMRTKGVPMLGHGRIFDFSEEFVTCEPFEIPDHWKIIGGMDFGYDHPQSQIQLAFDPDSHDYFITHAWKQSKVSANDAWGACKAWQKDIPVSWPLDGLMHEKGRDDAKQQADHYKEAGFNLLFDRATWNGTSNSVEQGIYEIIQLIQKGKFKAFRGLRSFFDEFLQYHRDANGKIVKQRDDVLDAVRYAYMMKRFAVSKGTIGKEKKVEAVPERVNFW